MQKNNKRNFFTPGLEKLPPHLAVGIDRKCTSGALKRWQFWAAVILASALPVIISELVSFEGDSTVIGAIFTGVIIVAAWKYTAASLAKVEIEKFREKAEINGTDMEAIPPSHDSIDVEAYDEISKFQLKGASLFLFFFLPVSVVLWFGLLFLIHRWHLSALGQGVFTFVVETPLLPLFAFFPAGPTGYYLYYFYLKKYHPIIAENEKKSGFKIIGFIIVIFCYAVPFPFLNSFTVFTNDEILHNDILACSTIRYSYDQITDIRSYTDKKKQDWLFVIWFSDGKDWSPNSDLIEELSDSEKRKLAAFVSQKSGMEIREVKDRKKTRRLD
ncbi:MAG: hypothetical protein GY795_26480 [Desulfobacterales bacterium]|nr:hypothetical protein [Desulfobacterales bacterium]